MRAKRRHECSTSQGRPDTNDPAPRPTRSRQLARPSCVDGSGNGFSSGAIGHGPICHAGGGWTVRIGVLLGPPRHLATRADDPLARAADRMTPSAGRPSLVVPY